MRRRRLRRTFEEAVCVVVKSVGDAVIETVARSLRADQVGIAEIAFLRDAGEEERIGLDRVEIHVIFEVASVFINVPPQVGLPVLPPNARFAGVRIDRNSTRLNSS